MHSIVTSISFSACESLTLTQSRKEEYKLQKWGATTRYSISETKDHATNEEVHAKIQQAIRPHEDLTIIKWHKLQWYEHVSHSSGLANTILHSDGGRRQGRQKKKWEDNREWTGLGFAKSQKAVENREKWRKLVVKSSVVPQWPCGYGIGEGGESETREYKRHDKNFCVISALQPTNRSDPLDLKVCSLANPVNLLLRAHCQT